MGKKYAQSITSSTIAFAPPRQIFVNVPLPSDKLDEHQYAQGRYRPLQHFCSNRITTSKYSLVTFLPKNLFEQFRRIANSYFLFLIVLQIFNEFQTVNPAFAAAPMIVIVAITAIKDAIEDYKRWKSDISVNSCKTMTLSSGGWRNYNYADSVHVSPLGQFRQFMMRMVQRRMKRNAGPQGNAAADFKDILPNDKSAFDWKETEWQSIRVGDVVCLHNDEPIPADMVIIATSESDCICYVETKNLDGETNLKLRQGPVETAWVATPEDCALKLRMVVDSEPPTTNMLRYQATLKYYPEGTPTEKALAAGSSRPTSPLDIARGTLSRTINATDASGVKKIPVDVNGVLMRGAVLRNTKWAIGIVVFTGEDTKQIMNSGKTPSKRSKVEKMMNPHIIANLLIMALVCVILASSYPPWINKQKQAKSLFIYYVLRESADFEGFINYWATLLLFQNIVPISLYISVEMVKTAQALFISSDLELYFEENDTPCVPRSWNLSDNLGQIEYIFSDKTGTLTRNIMEYKKCSIGGMVYDGTGKVRDESLEGLDAFSHTPLGSALISSRSTISFSAAWVEGVHEQKGQKELTRSLRRLSPDGLKAPKKPFGEPGSEKEQEPDSSPKGWYDAALFQYLWHPDKASTLHGTLVKDFFTLLSVCHTVLVDDQSNKEAESPESESEQSQIISYKAQSPDEACLVTLAAEMGFVFKSRMQNSETQTNEISVDVLGKEETFELLNVIEFDSDRKRMSVIVRTADNNVILFCKGADTIIFERLLSGQENMVNMTSTHLEGFAQEGMLLFNDGELTVIGLRTLCLAYKKLPNDFYENWAERYYKAVTQVYPDPSQRSKALEGLYNEVETGMVLLGATAIEDKLQDGVPECITALATAGIKIWVLTGDKIETAINIGFLCGLLKTTDTPEDMTDIANAEMILIQVKNASSEEELRAQLSSSMDQFFGEKIQSGKEFDNVPVAVTVMSPTPSARSRARRDYALIIDGQSLKFALENDDLKATLLDLGCRCKAVICCRVSPLQKAKVVEMVKRGKNVMTLAIGDGANDVSMIQAADVGVGISGEEGMQATMSSDYSIAQFRFLRRLLLVHGRWSYSRIAYMTLNFYLKNFVVVMVLFWFQIYCGFSASVIYDYSYLMIYNVIYTALPILVYGIFDQDISDELCIAFPQLYASDGIPHRMYTHKRFALYIVDSLWHSLLCFFIPMMAYGEGPNTVSGYAASGVHIGTTMGLCVVFNVNYTLAMDSHSWTWLTHFAIHASSIVAALFAAIYALVPNTGVSGYTADFFTDPNLYLSLALCMTASLGPKFIYYIAQRLLNPQDSDIIAEMQFLIDKSANKLSDFLPAEPAATLPPPVPETPSATLIPMTPTGIQQMRRRPSAASLHSVTYNMETGQASRPQGFSFSHTKGMSSVVLKTPISATPTMASRHRKAFSEAIPDTQRSAAMSGRPPIQLMNPPPGRMRTPTKESQASSVAMSTIEARHDLQSPSTPALASTASISENKESEKTESKVDFSNVDDK